MALINTQQIISASEAAATAKADEVLPQLIEGSEPAVAATVSAVFDILQAGLDAGLSKIPVVGGILQKVINTFLASVEKVTQGYIFAKSQTLQNVSTTVKV